MVRAIGRAYADAFGGIPRSVWNLSTGLAINRAGTMVMPFLSLFLVEHRGFPGRTAAAVLVAFGLGSVVGSYVGGDLSGRLGPIRVQRWSLALAGFAYLLLGRAESPRALVLAAFAASAIADMYRPACMSAVVELSPPAIQARCMGLLRLAANLGMAIGPAAGGILAAIDYDWIFVGDALTCWAAAAWLLLSLRRLGPVGRDARTSARRRRALLRDGPFLGLLGVMFVLAVVFFQVFYTMPLYLRQVYGLHESRLGLVMAANALLIAATEMVLIRRLEHRDPAHLLAAGALLVGLGLGLLPLGAGFGFALLTVAVWTTGEMLSLPFSNVLVARRGGPGGSGPAMGLYSMVFSAAAVTAPAAGLWVYDRVGPDAVWFAAASLALPLAAACLVLAPRLRRGVSDASVDPAHEAADRTDQEREHDAAPDAGRGDDPEQAR